MATRKSFDKERWEAMTGMEMSQLLPECENPESAGEVTDHAGNEILPTVTEQSRDPGAGRERRFRSCIQVPD